MEARNTPFPIDRTKPARNAQLHMIAFVWPAFCALAAAIALNASGRRLLAALVAPAAPALFLRGAYRASRARSRRRRRPPIAPGSQPELPSIAHSPF